jgi:hypothetical protein
MKWAKNFSMFLRKKMGNISINGGATTRYVTNTHPKLGG